MAEANSFAVFARASYPAQNEVADGVVYGDPVNVLTGTVGVADYPSPDHVREFISYDNGNLTGNCHVPPVDKVELGYPFDTNRQELGTLDPGGGATDYPAVTDVRKDVSYNFGALVGVYEPAEEKDVRSGVLYGANGTEYVGQWTGGDSGTGLSDRGWIG